MKKVMAYETGDGKTFTDKGDALNHEFFLEIRAIVQSGIAPAVLRDSTSVVNTICQTIRGRCDEMATVLSTHRQRIRRAQTSSVDKEVVLV